MVPMHTDSPRTPEGKRAREVDMRGMQIVGCNPSSNSLSLFTFPNPGMLSTCATIL